MAFSQVSTPCPPPAQPTGPPAPGSGKQPRVTARKLARAGLTWPVEKRRSAWLPLHSMLEGSPRAGRATARAQPGRGLQPVSAPRPQSRLAGSASLGTRPRPAPSTGAAPPSQLAGLGWPIPCDWAGPRFGATLVRSGRGGFQSSPRFLAAGGLLPVTQTL